LKDLMDPLAKIAKSTEDTSTKLDAVVAAFTGGSGSQAMISELQTQSNILSAIELNTRGGSGIQVNGKQIDQDKLKEGAEAIKMLGGGAASLAFGLLTFMLVPKNVIKKFTATIKDLMAAFDEVDEKKVKEGAAAFQMIAQSIGQFARGLAAAAFLLIPGLLGVVLLKTAVDLLIPTFEKLGQKSEDINKGAESLGIIKDSLLKFAKGLVWVAVGAAIGLIVSPIIILAITVFALTFAMLGKFDKSIKKGATALHLMGKALVWFGAGLVVFALASMFILAKPIILLAMVASLVLVGGAVALLGLVDKQIRKGSIALAVLGIGLAVFSIGYMIFAWAVKGVTLKDIGIQAAILLGIGLVTALAGFAMSYIVQGAIAVAAMGLGLLVFSLGYLPFAAVTKDMTIGDVGVQSGILLALGLEFAAAGFGALFILGGAAAFAAVGVSLAILSGGLLAFKSIKFSDTDATNLTTTLVGVKAAFLGTEVGTDEGFFSKLGGAITGAVDAVRMTEAAVGFTAAGVSLMVLSKGLNSFKSVSWTDDLSTELVTMLNGVTTAFALAGEEKQVPSTSFFGQMFGFKANSVEEGIRSVMGAGKALTNIAKGLKDFQSLINSGIKFGTPNKEGHYNEGTLGYAVTNTIGFIRTAFAAVGGKGRTRGGGFFDTLFDVKRNKVEEGIRSVMDSGKALTNIVNGLKSFQALIDSGVKFGKPNKEGDYVEGTLGYAVTNTVGFISKAFAAIADKGRVRGGGFFATLFDVKKNKVAEGIESVKGAGKELTNIATGLKSFQEMVDKDIDWDKLGETIKKAVTFVGEAFASIGSGENEQSDGWFIFSWDENKIKKGIDAVGGAGKELTNIVNGLKSFQALINSGVKFGTPNADGRYDDPTTLGYQIVNTLTLVGDAFANIGGRETSDGWFGMNLWDENSVKKGIDNIDGASDKLIDIAKSLKAFADLKNPKTIAKSIKEIFTSIGNTFTYYYEKPRFRSQVDHMQGFISEISKNAGKGLIHKAADGMSKMAAAINKIDADKAESFANLFKGAGELTTNTMAYFQLLNAVEDIRDALSGSSDEGLFSKIGGALGDAITGGGKDNDSEKGLGTTLKGIDSTLANLNSTMSQLPSSIQAMKITVVS
jgi:hypothetical protein